MLRKKWSIALYSGPTPLDLSPVHGVPRPILTGDDVTDVPGHFVADPFLCFARGKWHLFFEVMNYQTVQGVIGLATSPDAHKWSYEQVVLIEPFHLSYPHVFEHAGDYYMTPETLGANAVRLYRGDPFPFHWTLVATLVDRPLADPSVLHFGGRWWLFAGDGNNILRLYSAEELTGTWREHPKSPIVVDDPHRARPGGRVVAWDGRLFRMAQDCEPDYGLRVTATRIAELSPEGYAEDPAGVEVVGPGKESWNKFGMHHVDAHMLPDGTWLACVDGCYPLWSQPLS
jgi:hypothetical protein